MTVPPALSQRQPFLWLNPRSAPAGTVLEEVARDHALSLADVEAAQALLERWRPALAQLFPEVRQSAGQIESALVPLQKQEALAVASLGGRHFIKADHLLPVAGSIKARGGLYEVMLHAESLARNAGLLQPGEDPRRLLEPDARAFFSRHTVGVGSTGNLGLSIGVMAAALGFRAIVHMSRDAKEWKKQRLRDRRAEVVEHDGDYAAAVTAGRAACEADPMGYFVDDEHSRPLFLGYAVAALRLSRQLQAAGVEVDAKHPLFVYLPCGVGGAPGGITYGLKLLYGDAVHCLFAEPCASPAMLVRLLSGDAHQCSVYDFGLDNRTEADGLAVAQASELVYQVVGRLIDGVYTVADDELFVALAALERTEGLRIEPSSAAALLGYRWLTVEPGRSYFRSALQSAPPEQATHIFWTTGGSLVPSDEYEAWLERGKRLAGARAAL